MKNDLLKEMKQCVANKLDNIVQSLKDSENLTIQKLLIIYELNKVNNEYKTMINIGKLDLPYNYKEIVEKKEKLENNLKNINEHISYTKQQKSRERNKNSNEELYSLGLLN